MGKLIVSEFVTIDGIFEDPGGAEGSKHGGWSLKFNDEGSMKFKFDELMAADALLLGRTTYEGFAKAWPSMQGAGEFGEKMNGIPKHVVTKTLEKLDWQNSRVLEGELVAGITKLKKQYKRPILVFGSGTLVRALLEHGLADEYRLMMYPTILGDGRRLFDGAPETALILLGKQIFPPGTVVLTYATQSAT